MSSISNNSRKEKWSHSLLVWLWCALLLACSAYLFHGVHTFYFTGDDFALIHAVMTQDLSILNPNVSHVGILHYLVVAFPSAFIGLNPFYDNILLILFYLTATVLTIYLVRFVTKNSSTDHSTTSLAAGFLFLSFAENHEIMFWKSGRTASAMVILAVLSFICFAKYLKSRRLHQFLLANLLLFLALLVLEQACFVVLVWFAYEVVYFFPARRGESVPLRPVDIWRSMRKFALPLLVVASILSYKYFFAWSNRQGHVHVKALAKASFYGILDFNSLLSSTGIVSLVRSFISVPAYTLLSLGAIVLILAILALYLSRRAVRVSDTLAKWRGAVFFLLWGLLTYVPLIAITGMDAPRYHALSSVGVAIFFAILLKAVSINAGRLARSPYKWALTEMIFLVLTVLLALPGLRQLTASKHNWRKASAIEERMVNSLKSYIQKMDESTDLYLVNVPDSLLSGVNSYFIARNGFSAEVAHHLNKTPVFAAVGIPLHGMYPAMPGARSLSLCDVFDLAQSPNALILMFDPIHERLVALNKSHIPGEDPNRFVVGASGFRPWEFDPRKEEMWRWTTGDALMEIDLRCYPQIREVRGIQIPLAGNPKLHEDLVIIADNTELARFRVAHWDLRTYQLLFPAEVRQALVRQGSINIAIKYRAWRPSDHSASSDSRLLGVAIGPIQFLKKDSDTKAPDTRRDAAPPSELSTGHSTHSHAPAVADLLDLNTSKR
ncbi:MAG: hypothetical protein Kow0099_14160 [Candidatus Abyssubacteria bacterium]